ncbi:MAG: hypothetical protein IPL65_12835 [Lewinellaceae bacterium]|nr:hypothetical protein [Lewinellaceae bacterium]
MIEDFQFNFSQTNPDVVYCGNLVVNRSTDGGLTWTPITHWYNDGVHPEVHADLHQITYYPHFPETMFFCNDGGVYTFHEPTETWSDYSNGLGIAQFYRIAVSEAGDLKIAAGSQDNGGWLRMPFGNWKHTNGGDAMCQIIDPTNNNVPHTEYYGGNAIYRSTTTLLPTSPFPTTRPDDPEGDWVTPFILNPKTTIPP